MKTLTIIVILLSAFALGMLGAFIGVDLDDVVLLISGKRDGEETKQTQPVFTPRPTPTPLPEVRLVFVGDIMLSRSVGDLMKAKNDFYWPFRLVDDYLKSFDLAIGNLETTISDRGTRVGSIYSFRSDPKVAPALASAGFDILGIANNHIWDYGQIGFIDTLDNIRRNSMDYVGGGVNSDEAHAGIIKNVKGTKIGFLAYTDLAPKGIDATQSKPGISRTNTEQIKKDVTAMRPHVDVLAVMFHWGQEYKTEHDVSQELVAKNAISAGADIIVGHHPHVRQELIEVENISAEDSEKTTKPVWIAYSLGNFIFDQSFSKETMTGTVLEVTVKDRAVVSVEDREINISKEFQPQIVNP